MIQLMEEILHHFIGRSSHPIFTRSYASQVVVWVFWTINNTITISEMLENCTIKMITFGTLPRWMSFLGQRSFIPRSIRSSKKNIPKSVKICQNHSKSINFKIKIPGCHRLPNNKNHHFLCWSIHLIRSHACAVVPLRWDQPPNTLVNHPSSSPGGGCKHLAEKMGWNGQHLAVFSSAMGGCINCNLYQLILGRSLKSWILLIYY